MTESGEWKPLRQDRVQALWLAENTIRYPFKVIDQDNGTRLYMSAYYDKNGSGNGSLVHYLVVTVEDDGRAVAVTSFSTQSKKGDKK